jgi:hypothetical protein
LAEATTCQLLHSSTHRLFEGITYSRGRWTSNTPIAILPQDLTHAQGVHYLILDALVLRVYASQVLAKLLRGIPIGTEHGLVVGHVLVEQVLVIGLQAGNDRGRRRRLALALLG